MKTKKMLAILFTILCTLALTACSLALEAAGEGALNQDRFIGGFITFEYPDLFDMDRYINDNLDKMIGGREIEMGSHGGKYGGRLYAVLKEKAFTHEETGEVISTKEYVFEDMEGISYFAPTISGSDGSESYITTCTGPTEGISDGKTELFYGDDEEKTTLKGTIYMAANLGEKTMYINPVYQSSDGSVYAVTGSGFSMGGSVSEGGAISQAIEETPKETVNGHSKEYSTSLAISLEIVYPPEKIVVQHMDPYNNVLMKSEYSSKEVPDRFIPKSGADYLIVETHKRGGDGEPIITRDAIDKNDESFDALICGDDGICIKKNVEIIWED